MLDVQLFGFEAGALAGVLIDVGRREEAIRQIVQALRIDPGNAEARRMLDKLRTTGPTAPPQ